jgi:hypothetical protein
LLGRRGTVADTVWVNRRLLLTGAEHLSAKQWTRLHRMLEDHDPTNEIGAAWGVKERPRMLLAEHEPSKIRWRLADFYDAAIWNFIGIGPVEIPRAALAALIEYCIFIGNS